MKNFGTMFILFFLISCNKTKDIKSVEKTDSIKSQFIKERDISQKNSIEERSKIIEDEEGNVSSPKTSTV